MNVALIECDNCHSDVLIKTDKNHTECAPAGWCYLCGILYVQNTKDGTYTLFKEKA